jgi:hypothetical protein
VAEPERWAGIGDWFEIKGERVTQIIAYCGLACQTCPIYLATRQENKEEQARMRAAIAQLCKEQYGMNYEPEDITDCDGCPTEGGRLFSGCKDCAIRKCAGEKGLENCAYCREYPCDSLTTFFAADPTAKTRLDEIRSSIV